MMLRQNITEKTNKQTTKKKQTKKKKQKKKKHCLVDSVIPKLLFVLKSDTSNMFTSLCNENPTLGYIGKMEFTGVYMLFFFFFFFFFLFLL